MSTSVQDPPGRISQLLPTVKCSSCGFPVPLSDLGEHVCETAPPLPQPSSALLAQRLNLVSKSSARKSNSSLGSRASTKSPPPAIANPVRRPSPAPSHTSSQHTIVPPLRTASRASTRSNNISNIPSGPIAQRQPPPPVRPTSPPNTRTVQKIPSPPPRLQASPSPAPSIPKSRPQIPPQPHSHVPQSHIPQPNPQPHSFPPQEMLVQARHHEPDLRVGGEAGMAGVGRRGFAIAARAAMFTTSNQHHQQHSIFQHPHPHMSSSHEHMNSMQGRRANSPRFLDINTTTLNTTTPPLTPTSPLSTHSHSTFPISPSPVSPSNPTSLPLSSSPRREPIIHTRTDSSLSSDSHAQIPSRITRQSTTDDIPLAKPTLRPNPPPALNLKLATANPTNVIPVPASPAVSLARLPFFEKFKTKLGTPVSATFPAQVQQQPPSPTNLKKAPSLASSATSSSHTGAWFRQSAASSTYSHDDEEEERQPNETLARSPSPSSGSEYGLAYADDTDYEGEQSPRDEQKTQLPEVDQVVRPRAGSFASPTSPTTVLVRPRTGSASSTATTPPLNISRTRSASSSSSGSIAPLNVRRTRSASSTSSSSTPPAGPLPSLPTLPVQNNPRSPPRTMETLWEDSISSPNDDKENKRIAQRSNTVAVSSPDRDRNTVKLPVRSRTERDSSTVERRKNGASGKKTSKVRVCMRCEKTIDDGRWIRANGENEREKGGVLCERCWKNMYLPKCRRCNLPIENQAVSSSDGQLKGKYHKECFNCHTCHEPFPDKTFYVHDGKPLCAYHYHEANDSLCAAALCGQPVEGPCAVSHAGDRYHPHCLTCEYDDGEDGVRCTVRLVEYWEVDGRMLCESHALGGGRVSPSKEKSQSASIAGANGNGGGASDGSKARKRVTRFIDLAALNAGGAAGVGNKF